MIRRILRSTLLHAYSLLWYPLAMLLRWFALFHPRLRAQVSGRGDVAQLASRLAVERARFRHGAVFFCSSAGEFEQAKPLIARLQAAGSVYVQVVFFSRSGLAYAQARGETVPCCLSPLTDTLSAWGWLFSALRTDLICVVRHELWPGFLGAARHFGHLCLIDASCSQGEQASSRKRWLRSSLMQMFHRIYTVSPSDLDFFRRTYGVDADRLACVGDTKYDRVLERARERVAEVAQLKSVFDQWLPTSACKRLVLGSAYREEVTLWLQARALRSASDPVWQVLIAPHHLAPEFLDWVEQSCKSKGLSFMRQSALRAGTAPSPGGAEVILIDSMGQLSEAYGSATAAFVGGALHHQVHNVLEPACHGLALAFGPAYKNSHEAIHLVDLDLAKVVPTEAAFVDWWRLLDHHSEAMADGVQAAVRQLSGASDRIMTAWQAHLGS